MSVGLLFTQFPEALRPVSRTWLGLSLSLGCTHLHRDRSFNGNLHWR
jgi:hypothetical protein